MSRRTDRRFAAPPRRRVLMALGYYDHQLHRGIVRYAREAGWILDTSMAHYGVIPDHWQGDGIITLLLENRKDILRYLKQAPVPVVSLTTDVEELAIPRVQLDNRRIGQLAAEHLVGRGFENLGFYKFSNIHDVRDRQQGFRRAVKQAGCTYIPLDWHAASERNPRRNWFDWLKSRLQELPLPIGIMAQSDNRASLLISACEAVGIAVPEQVAVVGVDNDEYACEFASVPISSVDSNREALAYEGAVLLGKLMAGARPPRRPIAVAPKGVVVRKSSDILAIDHKAVARALSFIWEHFWEPIGVDDVIEASRMSRCGLYRAFEKHVGRSIGDELARKRVERAQKLLAETNAKLHRIAGLSGFSGGEHFSRAFTRIVGTTPSAYRQERLQNRKN
ncbi:MAG: DNA-binding transcriptional regulator [Thermoguttaceae bacterium]|jgi:LacI family transcriptional regulator